MTSPRVLVSLLACLLMSSARAASTSVAYPAAPTGPGARRQPVFPTRDEEYRSEEGLPMLAKILSQRHGFRWTVLFTPDEHALGQVLPPGTPPPPPAPAPNKKS